MTEYAPIMLGEDPQVPDDGYGEPGVIVGVDPLEFHDGDVAYAETYQTPSGSSSVSFRLPPGAAASSTARVWISAEGKHVGEEYGGLVVSARPPGEPFAGGLTSGDIDYGPAYALTTPEIDFTSVPSRYGPDRIIRPDTIWYLSNTRITGSAATVRTTYLRIIVEDGVIPLQWNQRPDGAGREGVDPWRSEPASLQWRPVL